MISLTQNIEGAAVKPVQQLEATTSFVVTSIQDCASAAADANIWRLSLKERQDLLCEWRSRVEEAERTKILTRLQTEHNQLRDNFRAVKAQRDIRVIASHNIVGLTTTAMAGRMDVLSRVGFEILEMVSEDMTSSDMSSIVHHNSLSSNAKGSEGNFISDGGMVGVI